MIRALYSSAAGMQAQQLNIDTVANNLANVNTIGFKKGRAEFQDLLYEEIRGPNRAAPVGIQVGHGARLASIQRIFSGGPLNQTDLEFDLAIEGGGFFRLQRHDGSEVYSRDGSFRVDGLGRLTNSQGLLVLGADGPIRIEGAYTEAQVSQNGVVSVIDAVTGERVEVGEIDLAIFTNPSGLLSLGENLWATSAASGQPVISEANQGAYGRIIQGYLEASNVETVEEMVNLIVAQRAYEISSKAVQSADEMMALANNVKR